MSTTEDHKENTVYELAYLILPSIPEEHLSKVVSNLKEIIKKAGGSEIASEEPFKHPLAYSMSKVVGSSKYVVNEAYIGWIKFESEPSSVEEVKTRVEKLDEVLRFLLVKAPRETAFTFEAARARARAQESESETSVEESAPEVEVAQPETEEGATDDVVK